MAAVKAVQPPAEERAAEAPAAPPEAAMQEDNLEIIEGVGPIYAKRLREVGITTYKQLAEATYEQLVKVTRGNLERVVKEDWRGQARRMMNQK
jgi:predicted flap endonuclease-1-like 5' DNA nuclease